MPLVIKLVRSNSYPWHSVELKQFGMHGMRRQVGMQDRNTIRTLAHLPVHQPVTPEAALSAFSSCMLIVHSSFDLLEQNSSLSLWSQFGLLMLMRLVFSPGQEHQDCQRHERYKSHIYRLCIVTCLPFPFSSCCLKLQGFSKEICESF